MAENKSTKNSTTNKELEKKVDKEVNDTEDIKIDLENSKIDFELDSKKESNTSNEKPKDEDALSDLPESIRKKLEATEQNKKQKINKRKKKSKVKRHVPVGKAFIKATYNNTIISLTDMDGNVISWASTGMAGFKGPKKSTSYAAQIITRIASEKAKEFGLQEAYVYVKGVGTGREAAIRTLNSSGIIISTIKDVTPIPHNGCRPTGPRRV